MKGLICIAVFLLLVAPLGSAEPIVFFSPQSPTISVGDSITVDVMISGVVSPWLADYDIVVNFNPALTPIFAVHGPTISSGSLTSETRSSVPRDQLELPKPLCIRATWAPSSLGMIHSAYSNSFSARLWRPAQTL